MTNANVAAALDELRREYAEVGARVERMQHDSTALETRHERLSKAIESLEGLTAPEDSGAEGAEQANGTPPSTKVDADWAVEEEPHVVLEEEENEPLVPADSPIAKYIKRGGKGRRLSSPQMVAAVVEELDRILTREQVKDAFFEKFSREEMERFWDRPDNAFGTALVRAVQDDLIKQGTDKGVDVYASPDFVRRLNAKRAADTSSTEEES